MLALSQALEALDVGTASACLKFAKDLSDQGILTMERLKKLSALGPVQSEPKVLEIRPASPRKLISGLPRVEFPYIRTLIEPNPPEIVFMNKLSPTKKFETPRRIDIAPIFVVDIDRQVLTVGEDNALIWN